MFQFLSFFILSNLADLEKASLLTAPRFEMSAPQRIELFESLHLEDEGWFSMEGQHEKYLHVRSSIGWREEDRFMLHPSNLGSFAFSRFKDDHDSQRFQQTVKWLHEGKQFKFLTTLFRNVKKNQFGWSESVAFHSGLPSYHPKGRRDSIPFRQYVKQPLSRWHDSMTSAVYWMRTDYLNVIAFVREVLNELHSCGDAELLFAWGQLLDYWLSSEHSDLIAIQNQLLATEETAEVSRILIALFDRKENLSAIKTLNEIINWLDYVRFLAAQARAWGDTTYPQILVQKEAALLLRGARHPSLDADSFSPFSLDLSVRSSARVQWLVGNNNRGKSTRKRAVALLVHRANRGLPVPANQMVYTPMDPLLFSPPLEDSPEDGHGLLVVQGTALWNFISQGDDSERKILMLLDELLSGTSSDIRSIAERSIVKLKLANRSHILTFIATHNLEAVRALTSEQDPRMAFASLDRYRWLKGFKVNPRQRFADSVRAFREAGWPSDVLKAMIRDAKSCDQSLRKLGRGN